MTNVFANTSTVLALLGWGVLLFFVQLFLQSITSTLDKGLPYAMGNQDEPKPLQSVYAGRIKRAFANLLETFPVFVALALALTIANKGDGLGVTGAYTYLLFRAAYLVIYVVGIPGLRTLVWFGSIVGLIMMLVRLMGA